MKIAYSYDERKNEIKPYKKSTKREKNMDMMEHTYLVMNSINTLKENTTALESDIVIVLLSIRWYSVKR